MRIGVNCFPLVANSGGMKQYFFSLFKELLSRDDGHRYLFFYFPHNFSDMSKTDGFSLKDHAVLLNDQDEIAQYFRNMDLYFCPFCSLWPRPVPIPSVLFMHDIQEVFYPQFFSNLDRFNREYHYPGSTRMVNQVITNSHFTKQTIVQHHRISHEKVTVAHLCADERFYRANEVARPPESPLPKDDFVFYPANHWPHKNHDSLLQALRWLKTEKGLIIDAVFTGYDVANNYPLVKKVSEYGLDGQIYYAGYVSVNELAFLYQKARIMVFPSMFEGFGIPLVEAMAVGCPVAASKVTSLPEIGGDAIEYFEPTSPESIGRAMEKTWFDRDRRNELISRGRKRAQDFSAERLAHTHLRAFQQAVESFSKSGYLWNQWIYGHYHRKWVRFKYRKKLPADSLS